MTSTSTGKRDERNNANSGTPASLTVRPRNRRLVSTDEDDGEEERGGMSRNASPLPTARLSRTAAGNGGWSSGANGKLAANERVSARAGGSGGGAAQNHDFGKGLWEGGWTGSWTALQGLASSVLGETSSDANKAESTTTNKDSMRRRKQEGLMSAPSIMEWGPTGPSNKGKGKGPAESLAARNSAVNVLKTASVMQSHEGTNGGLSISNHKRRTSDDHTGTAIADDEGDALVYVHHVKPTDTLAGVILKYNCEPAVFRKANRLWPNDAIQVRKVVLVPVDACAVRGRPCDPPSRGEPIDLLAPTPADEEPPNLANPAEASPWANGLLSSSPSLSQPGGHQPPPRSDADADDAHHWIHVRWVLLSASPSAEPTEIARLPRRTLGYFPPRRRKSQSTLSPLTTPRSSFDIPSPHAASPGQPATRRLSNLSTSMSSSSYFPSPPRMSATAPSRGSSRTRPRPDAASTAWFRGPGGVGTFAPNVRRPGPAQDGLNSFVGKHLPGLAIGEAPPGDGLAGIEEVGTTGGGAGVGIEAAAAAIEGWVRRMGNRPVTPMGVRGRQVEQVGDLIELLDGAGSDDGRGEGGVGGSRRDSFRGRGGKGGKTE